MEICNLIIFCGKHLEEMEEKHHGYITEKSFHKFLLEQENVSKGIDLDEINECFARLLLGGFIISQNTKHGMIFKRCLPNTKIEKKSENKAKEKVYDVSVSMQQVQERI